MDLTGCSQGRLGQGESPEKIFLMVQLEGGAQQKPQERISTQILSPGGKTGNYHGNRTFETPCCYRKEGSLRKTRKMRKKKTPRRERWCLSEIEAEPGQKRMTQIPQVHMSKIYQQATKGRSKSIENFFLSEGSEGKLKTESRTGNMRKILQQKSSLTQLPQSTNQVRGI